MGEIQGRKKGKMEEMKRKEIREGEERDRWCTTPLLHRAVDVRSLVSCPARAHLPARNGLVNEVEFLGLITQNG